MYEQREFDFLVLALAKLDHGCVAAVGAGDATSCVKNGIRLLAGRNKQRYIGSHSCFGLFDVEFVAARRAGVLPVFDAQRFHSHYRAGHDWRPVAAASHLTGAMLGPEGVDDFRPLVGVVLPRLGFQRQRIKINTHYLAGRLMCPGTLLAIRPIAIVEGHDLRLYLDLNVGEQPLYFVEVDVRQLLLHDEPRDWIEIVARHLHAEPRALDQCCAAAHEDVGDLQMLEGTFLLMIGIVVVPDQLGCVCRIIRGLGCRSDQHGTKHA